MKHKGLIIIIGLLIFLVTIGSVLAIKPADLEKKLEWKGENLSVYPINTEVDIPLDYIEFKDIKQSAKDNDLKFKNLGANTIGIDKKDIEHFRIKSSQAIYQVKDIRETHEWGYLGTGYGVDTITAKSDLIKDGNYICLINSKETFSTETTRNFYSDCIYYPPFVVNNSNLVNINIAGNTATVTYPLPYDPEFGNNNIGANTVDISANWAVGHRFNLPDDGTVNNISVYAKAISGTKNLKLVIWNSSQHVQHVSDPVNIDTTASWNTATFSSPPSLVADDYYLGIVADGDYRVYYDLDFSGLGFTDFTNSYTSPQDTSGSNNNKLSIYIDYTVSGGNNAPSSVINYPSDSSSFSGQTWINISMTGADADLDVIDGTLYVDGVSNATNASLTDSTAWVYNLTGLSVGSYGFIFMTCDNNSACTNSSTVTVNFTAAADTTPPVISSVLNSSLTNSSALITWSTDENADSKVYYGLTGSYGSTNSTASLVTSHSINLYSLTSNTTYYYLVESCDNVSNCANSSQYSFTTNTTPSTPAGDNESTINFTTTELHTANALTGVNYFVDTGRNVSGLLVIGCDDTFADLSTPTYTVSQLGTITYATGTYNNACVFDGSSRIQHFDNVFDTNDYTINFWFKTTDSNADLYTYTYTTGTYDYTKRIKIVSNDLYVQTYTGADSYFEITKDLSSYLDDDWHSLSLIANSSQISVYIDGVLFETDTTTTGNVVSSHASKKETFGGDGSINTYTGSLDEISVYTETLTPSEALHRLNNGYNLNDSENIVLDPGTYNVTATKTGYYDLTQEATVSYDTDETITLTGMYDTILTITVIDANSGLAPSGTTYLTLDDYAANYNSTNGTFILNTVSGTTSYTFANTLYVDSTQNNTIVSPTDNFTVNLYTSNSLSLTFRDSLTESLINIVTVNYFSEADSGSNATTNGTLYLELLNPTTYTFILNSSGYHDNFYFVTIIDDTSEEITMYLNPEGNTTELTVSVIDGGLSPISNAIVKALKYYVSDNTYRVVASGITNPDGEILMNLATGSEFYKFVVLIDDVIVKTTTPFLITGTTLSIQVLLEDNVLETYREGTTIDRSLLFNTVSDSFRFDFTDANSVSRTICLNTYRKGVLLHTVVNSTCTTGTSGTILHAVTNISGVTYYSKATTSINSETVVLEQEEYTFSKGDIGNSGLLMQIALTIILSLSGFLAVELLFLLAPLSLVVGGFAGLHNIPLTFTVPLLIIGIIIMFMLRRNN